MAFSVRSWACSIVCPPESKSSMKALCRILLNTSGYFSSQVLRWHSITFPKRKAEDTNPNCALVKRNVSSSDCPPLCLWNRSTSRSLSLICICKKAFCDCDWVHTLVYEFIPLLIFERLRRVQAFNDGTDWWTLADASFTIRNFVLSEDLRTTGLWGIYNSTPFAGSFAIFTILSV